jgi:hypothetical protein
VRNTETKSETQANNPAVLGVGKQKNGPLGIRTHNPTRMHRNFNHRAIVPQISPRKIEYSKMQFWGIFNVCDFDHNVGADRFSHPSRYTTEYYNED